MISFNRKFWTFNVLVWSIVAVFTATQLHLKSLQASQASSWLHIFWIQIAVWWVWALFTPLIFILASRFKMGGNLLAHGLILLFTSVGIVLLYLGSYTAIWLIAVEKTVQWLPFSNLYQILFVNLFHWHFFICMAIVAFVHAYFYYGTSEAEKRRGLQLEKELLQNQLRLLKMQLQPHFLFNTLNSIVSAIHQEKTIVASEMTTGLSDLLRIALNDKGRSVVSLEEELNYVRTYLKIEQYRFKHLHVDYDISPHSLSVEVPNFFLQPIVENAIKHGISQKVGSQLLRISIQLSKEEELQIEVYNEGPSLALSATGIGVENVKQRLAAHYGKAAAFQLFNWEQGVMAQINIPVA